MPLGNSRTLSSAPPTVGNVIEDDGLRAELLRRREDDQRARASAPGGRWTDADRDLCRQIDEANTQWLADLVDKTGWPGASRVGTDGAHAAWLLAQHADGSPDVQASFLEAMRRVPAGEVSPADLAYLEDRCAVNAGALQLYGTQVTSGPDGEIVPQPIADPDRVDQRRAAVKLVPLADYLDSVRAFNRTG